MHVVFDRFQNLVYLVPLPYPSPIVKRRIHDVQGLCASKAERSSEGSYMRKKFWANGHLYRERQIA